MKQTIFRKWGTKRKRPKNCSKCSAPRDEADMKRKGTNCQSCYRAYHRDHKRQVRAVPNQLQEVCNANRL